MRLPVTEQPALHFSLRDTLGAFLDPLAKHSGDSGHLLTLEIEPEIADELAGDAGALCRVLAILVTNALANSAKGNIAVQVSEAGLDDDGPVLCFSVADTGSGMDAEQTATLFQPGPGKLSEAVPDGGRERGLMIARRLVEGMQGEIWAESVPGRGSLFQFTMPCRIPVAASPKEAVPFRHILLVDDVEINQELARVSMERHGHRVTVADNGSEAFNCFVNGHFDIIFMDIQMPVMDGYHAALAIRAEEHRQGAGSHVPIIAMTACTASDDRRKCIDAGMDFFISKPVKPEEIIAAIARFTGDRQASRVLPPAADEHEPELAAGMPAFDRDELMDRLCGKAEVIPRFTAMFINSVGAAIDRLPAALAAADTRDLYLLTHTIKGAAANIGAPRIRIVASELDQMVKSGQLTRAPGLLERLMAELERFRQAVGTEPR